MKDKPSNRLPTRLIVIDDPDGLYPITRLSQRITNTLRAARRVIVLHACGGTGRGPFSLVPLPLEEGGPESALRHALVARLVAHGVPAFGVAPAAGVLRRQQGALHADERALGWLLQSEAVPVLGCQSLTESGAPQPEDPRAVVTALAQRLPLRAVDVVTDEPRVRCGEGLQAVTLTCADATALAPESRSVATALAALQAGVPRANVGSIASLSDHRATTLIA